jgi:DNA-binding GntR family transcriptional regulator
MQPLQINPDVTGSVYEAILDAICDGRLEPGQRLVEGDMATRLGTSRLPVHQALKQLHREGFLVATGKRGLSVAAIDARMAHEVYELRAALDGAAAVADGDLRAMATADFNFHDFIYQLAGNRLISAAAHMNWHHVRRSILLLAGRPVRLGPFWDEHDGILQAVVNNDAAAAAELAQQHALQSAAVLSPRQRLQ